MVRRGGGKWRWRGGEDRNARMRFKTVQDEEFTNKHDQSKEQEGERGVREGINT